MKHCVIIGAGMAGLTAAIELQKNGWKVTVLDKGRGVGGRMATRRISDSKADHGAQFFSAKSPNFQSFTKKLLSDNIASEWQVEGKDFARFVGINGMSAIPKNMAQLLDVRTNERIIEIKKKLEGYEVFSESGNRFESDAILITSPAPQTIELLNNSKLKIDFSVIKVLNSIEYLPCIAVMALLSSAPKMPESGNITLEKNAIAWMADNFKKGISKTQTVTIHASSAYSKLHFDDDLNTICDELIANASEYVPVESIVEKQIHRWRYSLANKRYTEPYLSVNDTFILGGDGFGVGNIEGAFLSGIAMAEHLIKHHL